MRPVHAFSAAAAAVFWMLPGVARAHHFMGGGLPETFAQGLLSGPGHPLIGFSLVQLGVAAAAFVLHRRLIAAREARARPVSAGLGAVVGAVGVVFLAINIPG